MNKVKVVCYDEEMMKLCDNEFTVVTHISEEDGKTNYSGEFIIMDSRPEQEIQEKVRDIKQMIKGNTA